MDELLRMEHVSKRFGDFYANRDINLSVRKGEVHTLLGENGAGKSTLMNVLIGLYQPTEGKIFLNGQEVRIDSPSQAVKLGIGMVHQHFMLVEAMTVFDNIILGTGTPKGIFIDKEARKKEILELAERYGLDVELDRPITEIAVGAQQPGGNLKTLYRGAELLILDEPTAALTDIEVEGLFQIIHKLTEEGKKRHLYQPQDARGAADLRPYHHSAHRRGHHHPGSLRDRRPGAGQPDDRPGAGPLPLRQGGGAGRSVIQMRSVDYHKESKHAGLSGVSLTVGRGEIVGIAGVDGNGQSQLAQVVTGVLTPDGGEVDMKGSKVAQFTPKRLYSGKCIPHPGGPEQDGPHRQYVREGQYRAQGHGLSGVLQCQGLLSEEKGHPGLRPEDAGEDTTSAAPLWSRRRGTSPAATSRR